MHRSISIILVLCAMTIISSCEIETNISSKQASTPASVVSMDNNTNYEAAGGNQDSKNNTGNSTIPSDEDDDTKVPIELNKAIEKVKADGYYIEEYIREYNETLAYAVNNDDFNLIKNKLDENSNIYTLEKDFIKKSYSSGIKLKLIYVIIDEIKQTSMSELLVYATVKFEITSADNSIENKIYKKVFTVLGDNKVMKIKNIELVE